LTSGPQPRRGSAYPSARRCLRQLGRDPPIGPQLRDGAGLHGQPA